MEVVCTGVRGGSLPFHAQACLAGEVKAVVDECLHGRDPDRALAGDGRDEAVHLAGQLPVAD